MLSSQQVVYEKTALTQSRILMFREKIVTANTTVNRWCALGQWFLSAFLPASLHRYPYLHHVYIYIYIYMYMYMHNYICILIINWEGVWMDRTIKDLKKYGASSYKVVKKALYYGFIPLVIILGARTMKLQNFDIQQPMWSTMINKCSLFTNFIANACDDRLKIIYFIAWLQQY